MASTTKQTRRQYMADEKKRAVALAKETGVCATARELGIPQCNVSQRWAVATTVVEPPRPVPGPATTKAVAPTASVSPPPPLAPAPAEAPTKPSPTRRPRVAKVYTPTQIAQALERVAAIVVPPAAKELGQDFRSSSRRPGLDSRPPWRSEASALCAVASLLGWSTFRSVRAERWSGVNVGSGRSEARDASLRRGLLWSAPKSARVLGWKA